jgi:7,8-dihydroneopterin aldolase/epimerase/oxygenase
MTELRPYNRVFLRALTLDAHIGYYAPEKGVTQPLIVDVELTLCPTIFGADDIHDTVDYDRVAKVARELASEHVDLLETFAERLATRCLAFRLVEAVRVRLEKPRAVPGAMAGVEIMRVR